jgi:prepilin peptidase CpaA
MVSRLPMPETFLYKKRVPYGISIGIGAFIAFPSSPLFLAATGNIAP